MSGNADRFGLRTGWSVMVRRRAEEITDYDAPTVRALRTLPLHPWAGDKPVWLRITPSVVSGRRLTHPSAADASPSSAQPTGGPSATVPVRTPAPVHLRRVDDQRGRLGDR